MIRMFDFSLILSSINLIFVLILVIITYKYVKQLREDIRTSRMINFTDQVLKLHELTIEYPELMKVYKGHSNLKVDLKDKESIRRWWFIIMRFTYWEQMFVQFREGIIDKSSVNMWFNFMKTTIRECPEFQRAWKEIRDNWDKRFIVLVDAIIAKDDKKIRKMLRKN